MKLTKQRLRQIITEELERVEEFGSARGGTYSNVTAMSAKRIFDQLKTQGRNRSLTRGDEMDVQDFIDNNISSWSTSRDVKDAIVGYLVDNRFGNRMDYR